MKAPVYLHANYFEPCTDFERIFRSAKEAQVDGIELRMLPPNYSGSIDEYLKEITSAYEKYPLPEISFGSSCVDLMSSDCSERETSLLQAEGFYREAARRFPVKVINAFVGNLLNTSKKFAYADYWHHGSAIATDAHWAQAVEGMKRLANVAQECGFRFAFETHGTYLHDTIQATLELCRRIDAPSVVGLLWDHGNLTIFKETPTFAEVIERTGDLLFGVHLKNPLVPPSEFIQFGPLSAGILNIREQMQSLHHANYTGPVVIESPRPGDRLQFLKEDLAYLRHLLAELKD